MPEKARQGRVAAALREGKCESAQSQDPSRPKLSKINNNSNHHRVPLHFNPQLVIKITPGGIYNYSLGLNNPAILLRFTYLLHQLPLQQLCLVDSSRFVIAACELLEGLENVHVVFVVLVILLILLLLSLIISNPLLRGGG